MIRVLHVVKTANGAFFAAWQAEQLTRRGVEVHVALPSSQGKSVPEWIAGGAKMHVVATDFPTRSPWRLPEICRDVRRLVAEISPDIIHSHFVGTTLVLRLALGKRSNIPRIFQVPGPLHLEHGLFRRLDLESADEHDYWIGSSRYTVARYLRAGAPPDRLFLSYYGWPTSRFPTERTHILRRRFGISDDQLAVGNMNWMYPPKYYLGQFVGLKCHEDVIDALAIVTRRRADVVGLLVGGGWGRRAGRYEERLRARARKVAGDRIKMTGYVPIAMAFQAWPDFDCVVHVPLSENCGGVLEPLLAGVPTIGGDVGGIPELVVDGTTGTLVRTRRPAELAEAILEVLGNPERSRSLAAEGQKRARELMDPGRTAEELVAIYRHLLNASNPRPQPYEYSPLVSANAK